MNSLLPFAIAFALIIIFFLVFRAVILWYYKIDTAVDIAKRQLECLEQIGRIVERQSKLLNLMAMEQYDQKKIGLIHKQTGNVKFVEFAEIFSYTLDEYDLTIIKG